MIDKNWLVSNKTFNPGQDKPKSEAQKKKWKNLTYYTLDFEEHFENIDSKIIFKDMADQQNHIKKMIEFYIKYQFYNKTIAEKTKEQYDNFYFFKGYYYKIDELKLWLTQKDNKNNTFVQTARPTSTTNNTTTNNKPQLTISREAIRKITGYSPYVIPKWGDKQVYLEWQDVILQDSSLVILVDGSRQLGKSIHYEEMLYNIEKGPIKAQYIAKGDKILGSNYEIVKVVEATHHKKPSYKITLENGIEHIVSEEHRIPLSNNFNGKTNTFDSNILTNRENYINAKELYNKFISLKANLFIPIAFNYSDKLPKYKTKYSKEEFMLLGYFIGDGCRGTNTITGNHNRLLNVVKEYEVTRSQKTKGSYSIKNFKQKTNFKGVDLYSYEKFIDNEVFLTSTENKYSFLEGIFNTDSYLGIYKNQSLHIEYCSTSQKLIKDLQALLLQLGIICKIREKKIKSNFTKHREFAYYLDITDRKSIDKLLSNIDLTTKTNYENFLHNDDKILNGKNSLIPLEAKEDITNTNRQNKKPNYPFQRNNWLNYNWVKIKDIEFLGEGKVVTIKVDSDDELYFSNNVLTHNSLTIAEKAVELSFLPNEDTLVGGFIKKTTDVIRNYMLKFINNFDEGLFVHYKSEGYILNTKSGTKIFFRTLDGDAENVLGLTLSNIIIDEAQLVSDYVYEEVLEPTLATTNGRKILIGTPGKTAKGYYYDLIMEAKKGVEKAGIKIAVQSESDPDVSYYQIDITQNPLVNPRIRKKVMENKDKAKNQRQWFCNWNSGEDQLFKPIQISEYPTLSQQGYFTITFDPARAGTDRSAFCVTYTFNGIVYIILSGFVPKNHKKKWSSQINYYANGLIKQFLQYKKVTFGVDLRGIGEGFTEAFNNYYKQPGQPDVSLITVGYTSGERETIKGMNWKVSKTLLISNAVDMMDEENVKILKVANADLLEELQFLYEDEDNKGRLAMKSTFKDDIANSMLVNLYIIHTRGYSKRSHIQIDTSTETIEDWNKDFETPKRKKRKNNKVW